MGSFSIWHWLILLVVVLLLFGGSGKISKLMGDMAKGVKSFKQGLKDEDEAKNEAPPPAPPPQVSANNSAQPEIKKDGTRA
jgi:sec-independent protein translocase protein TatA